MLQSSLTKETHGPNFQESFSLDSVRKTLIRQEETIIYALIERAQYCRNDEIYQPLVGIPGVEPWLIERGGSFLDFMLSETEKVHARARRYKSPEEHAFFPECLPAETILEPLDYPSVLTASSKGINVNSLVMDTYQNQLVPAICLDGDDQQHGSSALCDITVLQALSRRIHNGKFVAESKFSQNTEELTALVKARDVDGIYDFLTFKVVEEQICARARVKAALYGQDAFFESDAGFKVDPNMIVSIYRDMIMPLTKQVQILYLFDRVGVDPPSYSEMPDGVKASCCTVV